MNKVITLKNRKLPETLYLGDLIAAQVDGLWWVAEYQADGVVGLIFENRRVKPSAIARLPEELELHCHRCMLATTTDEDVKWDMVLRQGYVTA